MIQRRTPLKRSTVRIPARRSKPRRGPANVPADEWRNPAYRAFLRAEGKCPACEAMLRNPRIDIDVRMDKLRPGMVGGFCDPAHGPVNGMGSKGPDAGCVPLCRGLDTPNHHDEQHKLTWGVFEAKYGFNREREAGAWFMIFQVWRESV